MENWPNGWKRRLSKGLVCISIQFVEENLAALLDDCDGMRSFIAHVVVMDSVFVFSNGFDFFNFLNVFAILCVATEFPDGVATSIAEFFVVSVPELFCQSLCAIFRDDGIVRKLVSENMSAVERLDFVENFCIECVADA